MSDKVYIVLMYLFDGEKDVCWVREVYGNRKQAEKKARRLNKHVSNWQESFHVIEKTLKGKYCLFN